MSSPERTYPISKSISGKPIMVHCLLLPHAVAVDLSTQTLP